MAFNNGMFIDKLLNFSRNFLNLVLRFFFSILYGNGGGIFVCGNGIIGGLFTFGASPLITLGFFSLSPFSLTTVNISTNISLEFGASSLGFSSGFLFAFVCSSCFISLGL